MTILKMIVAMTRNGGIGYKGDIPWYYSQDLKRFRKITGKSPIIMGRKTWDSLPKQPLPNRLNVVLTRDPMRVNPVCEGMTVVSSPEEALEVVKNYPEAWIIGGQMIYEKFILHPLLKTIDCTIIPNDYECDTYFTNIPDRFTKLDITKTQTLSGDLIHRSYSVPDSFFQNYA
jgi:dihydrofolate reductase